MFDFAWSEIALIGVVALIAIGPKDMPATIKAVTDVLKKARRMASEFQTHVDQMVRDANLEEVRNQIGEVRNDLRNLNVRGEIEKAIDADGSLRSTLSHNPLDPMPTPAAVATAEPAAPASEPAATTTVAAAAIEAPAFIPPAAVPAAPAPAEPPPAFIPPGATRA
jgi:sec-independent protein translocase protein TatB